MPNRFRDRADETKPREKMAQAPSLRSVASEDLLAVLLKTGAPGCDVSTLASRLLAMCGSTARFVRLASDWRALRDAILRHNDSCPQNAKILGVGDAKLMELAGAMELARRGLAADEESDSPMPSSIRSVSDAVAAFRLAMRGRHEQENFFVLPVNLRFVPMSEPVCITRGGIASTPVHPREVFREAVRWGAHAIAVAHNHPSGNPAPSAEDIALTRRLLASAADLGIPLIDHIIIGTASYNGPYTSLKASGAVDFDEGKRKNGK